jgi:hypothetical protein
VRCPAAINVSSFDHATNPYIDETVCLTWRVGYHR